jgi:hypothetical protein
VRERGGQLAVRIPGRHIWHCKSDSPGPGDGAPTGPRPLPSP